MVATAVKRRRGTTEEHQSFTGLLAEMTIDTDKRTVVVHDGSTLGGIPLASETYVQETIGNYFTSEGILNTTHVPESLGRLDDILLVRSVEPGQDKTVVPVSMIPTNLTVKERYSMIRDTQGTLAVATKKIDANNWEFTTLSYSPLTKDNPTFVGQVATRADLPLTEVNAYSLWNRNVVINDYAEIISDENHDGSKVNVYIDAIDSSGNITWGRDRLVVSDDYQAKTDSTMSGKVLIGGGEPGTYGIPRNIDTSLINNSTGLLETRIIASELDKKVNTDFGEMKLLNVSGNILDLAISNNMISGQYYVVDGKQTTGLPLPASQQEYWWVIVRKAYTLENNALSNITLTVQRSSMYGLWSKEWNAAYGWSSAWISTSSIVAMDTSRIVNISPIPTTTSPHTMMFDGYIVAAINSTGGEVLLRVNNVAIASVYYTAGTPSIGVAARISSPLILKGSQVTTLIQLGTGHIVALQAIPTFDSTI